MIWVRPVGKKEKKKKKPLGQMWCLYSGLGLSSTCLLFSGSMSKWKLIGSKLAQIPDFHLNNFIISSLLPYHHHCCHAAAFLFCFFLVHLRWIRCLNTCVWWVLTGWTHMRKVFMVGEVKSWAQFTTLQLYFACRKA